MCAVIGSRAERAAYQGKDHAIFVGNVARLRFLGAERGRTLGCVRGCNDL